MKIIIIIVTWALAGTMLSCEADKLFIDAPDVNVNGGPLEESLTPTSARVRVIVSTTDGVKEVGIRYGLQSDRAALLTYGTPVSSTEKKSDHLFDITDCESATRYSYVAYALLESGEVAYSVVRGFTTIAAELVATPARLSFDAGAHEGSLTIYTTFDAWDVVSGSEDWFSIQKGGDALTVTTTENLTDARRVATLKFTAGSRTLNFAITQDAPTLTLAPEAGTVAASGGSGSFTVTSEVTAWSVSSNAEWLTFSVDGNTVTYTATGSGGSAREGQLTLSIGEAAVTATFTVTQAP
ncbi:MAG: BACON domain-containing protein [Odoribacteraceae bacterium]|jgi:hypothetical protein|nr:BACON domain-containing protein [Odoribacteraceae bacterium]